MKQFLFRSLLLLVAALPFWGQGFPFLIRVQQTDLALQVGNGASITVNTPLNRSDQATVTLTYVGAGQVTLNSPPDILGSTAFEIVSTSPIPSTLVALQSFSYVIRFTPRRSALVSAQVVLPFTETITVSPTQTAQSSGTAALQFLGTAPELVVSYLLPDTQNYTPLAAGGNIPFPVTEVNGTNSIILSIANRGSGLGEINSILVSGEAFSPAGLPLLPANLQPGNELRVAVRFQPAAAGAKTGGLSVVLSGVPQDFTLSGTAFQIAFEYEFVNDEGPSPLVPGQTINLGEVLPGEILTRQIFLRNINPVAVNVPAIALFGAGFGAFDVPPPTRSLRPGETVGFFLQAQPAQVGALRGRLRIGAELFELLANGTGAQLRYSYSSSGSDPINLTPPGVVFFSPSTIGQSREAIFTVRNTGISAATIVNIALADLNSAFSIPDPPTAPARLEPGAELSFRILFRPTAPGLANVQLRVDSAVFTLAGNSTALPPLPPYSFSLSSGNVGPGQQLSASLTLREPFPVALTGVLILGQEPAAFAPDPSVRFITGGNTVTFSIPANSTRAVFANGLNTIRFQTGSVAGQILLRATFATSAGPLEDPLREIVTLTIPPSAPSIVGASVVPGTNALLVVVSGTTVTRNLTRMELELQPVSGQNIENTRFTIDLQNASAQWFPSLASEAFGGNFTLQLPLNFSRTGNTVPTPGSNLIDSIASVSVSVANEVGTSSTRTIPLR
ncbi:choice-of-anchor D domain-containing protein [Oscillatoria amoena NRMC-F 0135]|nr:choice-of-anchor D domain-containing protein [Oscillatoria amoena NRMC-F 0135]